MSSGRSQVPCLGHVRRQRLRARLTAEGLEPGTWSNGPHDRYGSHDHGYDKVIVVEAGSIRFGLDAGSVELAEGDRLELVAGTAHDAVVGPGGVTCLEAHLPQGSLLATDPSCRRDLVNQSARARSAVENRPTATRRIR